MAQAPRRHIAALKVEQWLDGWNKIKFSAKEHRRKPRPHFYMFTLPAAELRSLCGISRRQSAGMQPRATDLGIQRQHDPERSDEISRFVEFGYPWSTLSEAKRESQEYNDLRKPGWLPTAIVVNILEESDDRYGETITKSDAIEVTEANGRVELVLPYSNSTKGWRPKSLPPLEVIDGQHRLWAFDNESSASNFELPVIAYHGLDVSWQAYLFWTINIKPKRINSSLAFDLYPLLRSEDWLDRAEGHPIYRETRSQELTEALWAFEGSPWYDRINMLGERQNPWVTQASWIKTLIATFVRPWGAGKIGGLFGSRLVENGEVLGWSRAQQAAFLIFGWQQFLDAVKETNEPWAKNLRLTKKLEEDTKGDCAFYGPYSLISTDQGVRGFMHLVNDLCFVAATKLELRAWHQDKRAAANDMAAVDAALKSLAKQPVAKFVTSVAKQLAKFDWRLSSTPNLPEDLRRQKLVFRGSSGYKELRIQLVEHMKNQADRDISNFARRLG